MLNIRHILRLYTQNQTKSEIILQTGIHRPIPSSQSLPFGFAIGNAALGSCGRYKRKVLQLLPTMGSYEMKKKYFPKRLFSNFKVTYIWVT